MKAVVYKDYTANIEIIDIAKPKLQNKSVLVEVHAASINPIDNILHAGYLKEMLELSFPHIMGYDVSGKVVEVGKDVLNVKVGDEVFARPNQEDAGSIAEFARIQENELAIKPENLSHIEAASVPLAGLTAWQALVTKGNIKQGDKVLIHAGSGGVGTLDHLYDGITTGGASAVLAASIFHYGEHSIKDAKEYLNSKKVPIRL